MFAKTVDCQSRLSINLFLIAVRHGGRESYASRGRRPGVSGVDGDNGLVYDGGFPIFAVASARGAFAFPFALTGETGVLGGDISYFVRSLVQL
jgi:hypothetical protein